MTGDGMKTHQRVAVSPSHLPCLPFSGGPGVGFNVLHFNVISQTLCSANPLPLLAVNDEMQGLCLHFGTSQ